MRRRHSSVFDRRFLLHGRASWSGFAVIVRRARLTPRRITLVERRASSVERRARSPCGTTLPAAWDVPSAWWIARADMAGRRPRPATRAARSARRLGDLRSPQRAERGPELRREQFRLLPGSEVAASFGLAEVAERGVGLRGPAPRRPPDLAGEAAEAHRDP